MMDTDVAYITIRSEYNQNFTLGTPAAVEEPTEDDH
jgi:hypothetical protein